MAPRLDMRTPAKPAIDDLHLSEHHTPCQGSLMQT